MPEQLVFFDIPGRDGKSWSLNPWKIRLALNYKNIDYKTEWLEYPDIEPTLKSFGLEGDHEQIRPYTCPTAKFPDGTYIMNSKIIVKRLEKDYPEPPLHLDSELTQKSLDLASGLFDSLHAVLLPLVPRHILGHRSAEYFWRTRKEVFQMSLDELEEKKGGEAAWEAAKQPIADAEALLNKTEGPFFLGDKVSYADFLFVSFLFFVKRLNEEHYQRIAKQAPAADRLYRACEQWLDESK
ncbi:Glutathione S-transferase-like protein ustS [Colletotrichum trifolii]|uniref:Glutathione S-transferase-like protein ustS n=1 Tax=Colletotrichum trifolii TaxID=5466 RepID=A0A4V3HTV1_COLTR|nr:Glutathione S-transferase-like protein ustS [Colletotrichum trifolii]